MQDAATFYWIIGVMGIMAIYAVCAIIGVMKSKNE